MAKPLVLPELQHYTLRHCVTTMLRMGTYIARRNPTPQSVLEDLVGELTLNPMVGVNVVIDFLLRWEDYAIADRLVVAHFLADHVGDMVFVRRPIESEISLSTRTANLIVLAKALQDNARLAQRTVKFACESGNWHGLLRDPTLEPANRILLAWAVRRVCGRRKHYATLVRQAKEILQSQRGYRRNAAHSMGESDILRNGPIPVEDIALA